ncbi:MAG: vitamin B12 dependent-methionine synthase activation domain-containing protein [Rhodothermia bacterium]|nr:MAG: vitamin B12 dependent-methionine synthase activation domain-containing protein [Rhodothermia bacterium]
MKVRIQVPREEVKRYLGYPAGAIVKPRIESALDELWPIAMSLLDPKGVYRILSKEEVADSNMPDPSDVVGIAVCTIGSGLVVESADRGASGQYLVSLILDAFGSAAAEATADVFSKILCNEATKLGLFAQRRISPGYGAWDTCNQRVFLALLSTESVGISLTPGQMMRPRKSVSFAVRFLEEPDENLSKGCAHCTMKNCEYRLEEMI